MYYKSYRIVDGKPAWVISDENNNIIKDPTIEMKKMAVYDSTRKRIDSNFGIKERKCCICGSNETYVDNSGVYVWNKHKDENGNWDGISYTCKKCHRKEIFELEKIDPESHYNYMKSNAKYRTRGFDLEDSRDKFIIGESVVCKVLGIGNINIIEDNFNMHIDAHHDYYGNIDVKIDSPTEDDKWKFHTRRKWDCNNYFFLGVDENWKNIETVLIIPNDGWITDISSINISRYPKYSSKYDQFRVNTRIYYDAYKGIMEFLKDKRFFTVEDTKKWLDTGE